MHGSKSLGSLLFADPIVIDPDILQYGARKEVDILEYQAYHASPGMEVEALQGNAVYIDATTCYGIEAAQETDRCGLSGT